MISNAAQYALRAVTYLAAVRTHQYIPVRAIAEELVLPRTFLAKVFKDLVVAGICVAYRGPTGGVRLAKPSSSISVREVLEAIDGPGLLTECILGLPNCGEAKPCPMHESWKGVRDRLAGTLEDQTLESLAKGFSSGELRLKA